MKKKLLITLAVFLALVMACSLLALPALAVDAGDEVVTATKSVVGPDEDGYYTVKLSVTGSNYETDPQTEIAPADVVLVLDYSKSMNESNKLNTAKNAASSFITALTGQNINVGLVLFAGSVLDSQSLTTSAQTLINKLDRSTDWFTNYEAGLTGAEGILANGTAEAQFVVFLSDGEPTTGNGTSAFSRLDNAGVTVMTDRTSVV